jgi:hypothetical protein
MSKEWVVRNNLITHSFCSNLPGMKGEHSHLITLAQLGSLRPERF